MSNETLNSSIASYCASRPEVMSCHLFGSHAAGKEHPGSDVDVAFLVADSVSNQSYWDLTLQYMAELGAVLHSDVHPLIMNDAAEVILGQILGKGIVVYQRTPEALRTFRRRKMPLIAEFSYYMDMRLDSLRNRYGGGRHG